MTGIEPATVGLLDQCSTDWATRAISYDIYYIYNEYKKYIVTLPAGLEPATYWLTANRSANWAMEALHMMFDASY